MTETTATARFPTMEITIHHREEPGEAEYISVSIRATPSFQALTDGMEHFSPLLAWMPGFQMMQALWAPWLLLAQPRLLNQDRP